MVFESTWYRSRNFKPQTLNLKEIPIYVALVGGGRCGGRQDRGRPRRRRRRARYRPARRRRRARRRSAGDRRRGRHRRGSGGARG